MRIGNRRFLPGLLPSLVTALLFSILVGLGFWQLDRAEEKRTLQSSIIERQTIEPLNLNQYAMNTDSGHEILWRSVVASGYFDEEVQILLDNQVVHGLAGYYVYTPFQLTGKNNWILVNRGWVPAGNDRARMPELNNTEGQVSILGSLKVAPRTGILLKQTTAEVMQPGIYRLQKVDIAQISKLINRELMPLIIRLDPDSGHGYIRDWPSQKSGESRHLGYAFQWFALAATLIFIYLAVNLKKISDS